LATLDGLSLESILGGGGEGVRKPFGLRDLLRRMRFPRWWKPLVVTRLWVLMVLLWVLQVGWEVFKANIMNVLHDFHARGMFGKSLNATFILLYRRYQGP
jgi:hypothetical protein